eukprot:gene10199-13722_t
MKSKLQLALINVKVAIKIFFFYNITLSILFCCPANSFNNHINHITKTTGRSSFGKTKTVFYSYLIACSRSRKAEDEVTFQYTKELQHNRAADADKTKNLQNISVSSQISHVGASSNMLDSNESLTIIYLKQELKIKDSTLALIVLKYSWILYLNVEKNIIPTISVFKSFGLKDREIKSIIEQCPSILGINHVFSLPEKLLSLQKMFNLNTLNLRRVVVKQPFLLSSSIQRNLEISEFLSEKVGLNNEEMKRLISLQPRVAMTNLVSLMKCWSLLTEIIGFDRRTAKLLVIKNPVLLSSHTLKSLKERTDFFSSELGLDLNTHGEDSVASKAMKLKLKRLFLLQPHLMYSHVDYFLKENARVIKKWILDDEKQDEFKKIIGYFPALFSFNPKTLDKKFKAVFYYFTSRDEYRTVDEVDVVEDWSDDNINDSNDINDMDDIIVEEDGLSLIDDDYQEKHKTSVAEMEESGDTYYNHLNLMGDIIQEYDKNYNKLKNHEVDHIYSHDSNYMNYDTNQAINSLINNIFIHTGLAMSDDNIIKIIKFSPWIIGYRLDRTKAIIGSIAANLGMNKQEMAKSIITYPRTICLDIDGKIHDVLVTLASAAKRYLERNSGISYLETIHNQTKNQALQSWGDEISDMIYTQNMIQNNDNNNNDVKINQIMEELTNDPTLLLSYLHKYRNNPIRSLVREMFIRYPLILGTSLDKIQSRIQSFEEFAPANDWHELVMVIRRNDQQHKKWIFKHKLKQLFIYSTFYENADSRDPENSSIPGIDLKNGDNNNLNSVNGSNSSSNKSFFKHLKSKKSSSIHNNNNDDNNNSTNSAKRAMEGTSPDNNCLNVDSNDDNNNGNNSDKNNDRNNNGVFDSSKITFSNTHFTLKSTRSELNITFLPSLGSRLQDPSFLYSLGSSDLKSLNISKINNFYNPNQLFVSNNNNNNGNSSGYSIHERLLHIKNRLAELKLE